MTLYLFLCKLIINSTIDQVVTISSLTGEHDGSSGPGEADDDVDGEVRGSEMGIFQSCLSAVSLLLEALYRE